MYHLNILFLVFIYLTFPVEVERVIFVFSQVSPNWGYLRIIENRTYTFFSAFDMSRDANIHFLKDLPASSREVSVGIIYVFWEVLFVAS